jgi:hypothetical protein
VSADRTPLGPGPDRQPDPDPAMSRLDASRADIQRLLSRGPPNPMLEVLSPWAHRHPWALVSASAAVGATVVALRPWRWLPPPAVMASLLSQLALHALERPRAGRPRRPS